MELSNFLKMFSLLNIERFSDKKYFFRIPKIGWNLIGFWPGSDRISSFQIGLLVLNNLVVFIYSIFQVNFCYVNRKNFAIFADASSPLFIQVTMLIKIFVIVWKRHEVKEVLDFLGDSFYSGE